MEYKISKHAKERYAERIMDKTDTDIARFVNLHEDKINEDVNRMIEYGTCIYFGRQKETKNARVYSKDCWIIICDESKSTVITLYKIDLGLTEDFNKQYVKLMVDKLNAAKSDYDEEYNRLNSMNIEYYQIISDNDDLVTDYQSKIKQLNQLSEDYRNVINDNHILLSLKENAISDILNKLIGKKEF